MISLEAFENRVLAFAPRVSILVLLDDSLEELPHTSSRSHSWGVSILVLLDDFARRLPCLCRQADIFPVSILVLLDDFARSLKLVERATQYSFNPCSLG